MTRPDSREHHSDQLLKEKGLLGLSTTPKLTTQKGQPCFHCCLQGVREMVKGRGFRIGSVPHLVFFVVVT